jgi:hypothetical protein
MATRSTVQGRKRNDPKELVLALAAGASGLGSGWCALRWLGSLMDQFGPCHNWSFQEDWRPPAACLAAQDAAGTYGCLFVLCLLLALVLGVALARYTRAARKAAAAAHQAAPALLGEDL